jgi:hypothetical protein
MDIQQEEKENMEKSNSFLIVAGTAAFLLVGGGSVLSGGVSGGGGKESKSTAITGIAPDAPVDSKKEVASLETQAAYQPFVPAAYQPFVPSQYIQDAMAAAQSKKEMMVQEKTVGGSSVSPDFFKSSTTSTYEYGANPTLPFKSSNPNTIAAKAENIAYSGTNYGQLGESEFGSQFTKKAAIPATTSATLESKKSVFSGGGNSPGSSSISYGGGNSAGSSSTLHSRMGVR